MMLFIFICNLVDYVCQSLVGMKGTVAARRRGPRWLASHQLVNPGLQLPR